MQSIKLLWTLVVVLLIVTLYLVFQFFSVAPGYGGSYYAVYLESGDIYFGKLSRFPSLRLTDVYFLVQGQDDVGERAFALQRFESAVWGPRDYISINPDKVIWMTPLEENGGAMRAILGGEIDISRAELSPRVRAASSEFEAVE